MSVGVLYVLASVLTSVYGTCQSVDGQSVPWWILYQQKDRPYFHKYVDSTNSHRIKEHYPEKVDSVLSKVMSSVIDKEEAEYIIYSSDLINVKDIAGKTSIPTYSKWMHGILGTTSSWNSGFWILHNNLLFPALNHGALAVPGSKGWYATTVGDSTADLFYICLTAEDKGNITEMMISIMTGNPFIYKKKLQNHDFLQPYLKEVRPLQTSFGYEMSASMFMNCMYASSNNVSTNCLFTYAVTTGVGINVFTRPRGMIKHSTTFCYDEESFSHFDFLKLEKSSTLKSGFTHSMFALSDNSGTTCFGQDIAANAETVAVMICASLPKVHGSIIKSARLTQWSCGQENGKGKHHTENFPVIKQTAFFKPPIQKNEVETNIEMMSTNADNDGEKKEAKFCQMYDCDIDEGTQNKQELVNIHPLKSPLMKNRKIEDWYNEMVNDIRIKHIIENPRKKQKMTEQNYNNAIEIRGSLEVRRFLLQNVKAVLGLFCRDGCRYCQNAKEQFMWLAKSIKTDDLDFVIVNVIEPSLPEHLQVPFTPYVRYKFSGQSEWIDYSGKKYDIKHIVLFLHKTATDKRYRNDEYITPDANEGKELDENNLSKLERKRKRRETKKLYEDRLIIFDSSKEILSRIKRDTISIHIDESFLMKHIWKYNVNIPISEKTAELQLVQLNEKIKNKNKKANNRQVNTFLATSEPENTLNKIKIKMHDFFINNKHKPSDNGKPGVIVFDEFNSMDIDVMVIHVMNKNKTFQCWFSANEHIAVGATTNDTYVNINHFDTIVETDGMKSCISKQKFIDETCKT